jgi:putative ABC transport system substrate-binding protein
MLRREFLGVMGGATAMWSSKVRAQQPAAPVVALLAAVAAAGYERYVDAFRQGLKETGYNDGQNVAIEYRWAEGQYERLPAMAAELVDHNVSVVATVGGVPASLAAKAATTRIPIVFAVAGDPVKLGLVDSIARPTGNATGIAFLSVELDGKRLELLHQVFPKAASLAVLLNPNNPQTETQLRLIKEAAGKLGLQFSVFNASTEAEIDAVFAGMVQQRVDALVVGADSFLFSRHDQLAALAAHAALPAIYPYRESAAAGGLMSYGTDLTDTYRKVGNYVGRILSGAKPQDLPVQQSDKVELVINLKAAKTLGITFPLTLLGRADEVIE